MCWVTALFYDYYEKNKPGNHRSDFGIYQYFAGQFLSTDQGIYHITLRIAVFSAAIAFLLAVAYLAVFANGKAKEHGEAKKWVLRVLILSIAIFCVAGLITLIGASGMDA